jgi:NAD(P)-dependent dehydrogenase (short-subunit alcohol dehydrogenase family)
MQKAGKKHPVFPAQRQHLPGMEYKMKPLPEFETTLPGSNKLLNKVCIVTGGDSGIGRSVAVAFAKEGADIAIVYLNEDRDAKETASIITGEYSRSCLLVRADIGKERNCISAIKKITGKYGRIDVLVNNAGIQISADTLADIPTKQLERTFAVNIFSMFWLTKAALPYMPEGSAIINSSSVTAYRGSPHLLDYSATKGAIVSFTRSLSANLISKGIRVNGVAPGPVWTPLIPASFSPKHVKTFGTASPMQRAGQPSEIAPSYVFLASEDSRYITGQFIHPNGGEIING